MGLRRTWLVALLAGALLVGGAGAFLLLRGEGGHAQEAHAAEGVTVRVGEILTNLADTERPRYVQVAIELEVDGPKTAERLEQQMPRVRDAVIALLRATRYDELRGEEGMRTLGERIAQRLNGELEGQGRVLRVLFTAFLIQ